MGDLTAHQERQIEWTRRQEQWESLTRLSNYEVKCRTCKTSVFCHAADTIRTFIYEHAGHYTWITDFGKTKPEAKYQ